VLFESNQKVIIDECSDSPPLANTDFSHTIKDLLELELDFEITGDVLVVVVNLTIKAFHFKSEIEIFENLGYVDNLGIQIPAALDIFKKFIQLGDAFVDSGLSFGRRRSQRPLWCWALEFVFDLRESLNLFWRVGYILDMHLHIIYIVFHLFAVLYCRSEHSILVLEACICSVFILGDA
jgi:hypothetical protein